MGDQVSAAIANIFVDLSGYPLPQMKMHKLVYIADGWNLAINNEMITEDLPEAWANGPVFRLIWDRIRDFGLTSSGKIKSYNGVPYAAQISADQRAVIDHVWNKYRKFSQFDLSAMTHKPGTPWTKAYFERGQNSYLSEADMRSHYRELAMAGRV